MIFSLDQLEELSSYCSDLPSFLATLERPEIVPDSDFWSEGNLAHLRPELAWLKNVQIVGFFPHDADLDVQREQLDLFRETLISEAVLFSSIYPKMQYFTKLQDSKVLAVDTETTGLDVRVCYDYEGNLKKNIELVGLSIAVSKNKSYYLPVMHNNQDGYYNWDLSLIVDLCDFIHQEFIVLYHNAKFDRGVLQRIGVTKLRPPFSFFDTQILSFFHDPNQRQHNLKRCSESYLGRKMININELFRLTQGEVKKKVVDVEKNFSFLPFVNARVYAGSDSLCTYGLFEFFLEKGVLEGQDYVLLIDLGMTDVLDDIYKMGFPINLMYCHFASLDIFKRVDMVSKEIFRLVGQEFNIGSPPQLNHILFNVLKIKPLEGAVLNKRGEYSLDEENLEKLFEENKDSLAFTYIVLYRKLVSMFSKILVKFVINSFVDALIPFTRVRADYSQTTASTGRFSSSSSGGRERVRINVSAKTGRISRFYLKEDWTCGINTQGIHNDQCVVAPARRIKKIPDAAGLNLKEVYPFEIFKEYLIACAKV